MGILALLGQIFVNAFGKALTDWLGQKRAEGALRDLGAATEQVKVATRTADTLQKMDQAAAKADPTRAGVKRSLEEGTF